MAKFELNSKYNIMKRKATAVWQGTIKEGKGNITTQSKVLNTAQYSFGTRFEEGIGTNPEELIAAAHAGCFTMQLSAFLSEEGFQPGKLETQCVVEFKEGAIVSSHLIVKGNVIGISEEKFYQLVEKAEKNCPVSKVLNAEISSEATLSN